jgi:hypothetical protein
MISCGAFTRTCQLWARSQCSTGPHYEGILVVRVHKLVPNDVWSPRFDLINDFERMLVDQGTTIIKFFLYISPEEQLERFKHRLDDAHRQWKISDSDYKEREFWSDYIKAYEDMLEKCSTRHAPWGVVRANWLEPGRDDS